MSKAKPVCKDCPANVEEYQKETDRVIWVCTRYNMGSTAITYCPFKEANLNWNAE